MFQLIRGHLTMLGIEPTPLTQKFPIDAKLILAFLNFAIAIGLSALFLVYSANAIMDYMQCFCLISASIELGLCFAAIVLQKQRLFNYIESVEKLINKSKKKYFQIYNSNRK